MKLIPNRKISRRIFITCVLLAVILFLLEFFTDKANLVDNILSELTGIVISIALAVSILDWYDERRKKEDWKYIIPTVGPFITKQLCFIVTKCVPILFSSVGYSPGFDLKTMTEFNGNFMFLEKGLRQEPLIPLLKKHMDSVKNLIYEENSECLSGLIINRMKPDEIASQALSVEAIIKDLIHSIQVSQFPILALTSDSEVITSLIIVDSCGKKVLEIIDSEKSPENKPSFAVFDQKVFIAYLFAFVFCSMSLHDELLQLNDQIRKMK